MGNDVLLVEGAQEKPTLDRLFSNTPIDASNCKWEVLLEVLLRVWLLPENLSTKHILHF